jgi:hypothetical protein
VLANLTTSLNKSPVLILFPSCERIFSVVGFGFCSRIFWQVRNLTSYDDPRLHIVVNLFEHPSDTLHFLQWGNGFKDDTSNSRQKQRGTLLQVIVNDRLKQNKIKLRVKKVYFNIKKYSWKINYIIPVHRSSPFWCRNRYLKFNSEKIFRVKKQVNAHSEASRR